jgi:hypothetical protein
VKTVYCAIEGCGDTLELQCGDHTDEEVRAMGWDRDPDGWHYCLCHVEEAAEACRKASEHKPRGRSDTSG